MKKFVSPDGTLDLSRAWRRALVITLYALFSGLLILWASLPQSLPDRLIPVVQWPTLIGITALVIIGLVLHIATDGIADMHNNDLRPRSVDERQERVRNRAYSLSYVFLGPSLLTLVFLTDNVSLIWLFLGGLFLYATFPVAVLAWLEPSPIPENTFEERKLG